MTNLERITAKIFGETATATGDDPQIGQFGSALAGAYVGTTNVDVIQSLPAWSNGFIDSVTPNEQFPPLPEMTGFGKVLSHQIAYTLQKGIPEWDSGTTYYKGDFAKGIGEGKIYISKVDSNINNVLTDPIYWEEFSSGGSGHNLFDIVPKDHILSYEETKGFAQLGSYVYKEAVAGSRYGYPDFYAKVIAEYQDPNNTTETVSGVTITVNANGHKFYDIADKADIDSLFTTRGEAWFYGIDTTNERIFLPRSTRIKFGDSSAVGEYQQAGLPNVEGTVYGTDFLEGPVVTGAFYNAGTVSSEAPAGGSGTSIKLGFEASRSNSIYGNSNTVEYSSTKLIPYMVVGNTTVEGAIGEYVDVTTTENDTLPLFYGAYFDYTPNNVSWVLAGGQVASGTIYEFAYNELVNELTTPKYGLQVIEEDDMIVGVDYSTYWKVNQDQQYFIAPTKLSYGALTGGVYGDGHNLGLTNGTLNGGLMLNGNGTMVGDTDDYYQTLPYSGSNVQNSLGTGVGLGVTTDSTKSGLIAEQSTTAKLYFKVANAVQNLELLDAGEVLEAVNGIATTVANLPHITETYINGTSWYRVYSDGWCEQGGYIDGGANLTVTFLKPFANANYNVTWTKEAVSTTSYGFSNKTTTTCTFNLPNSGGGDWSARGYIA